MKYALHIFLMSASMLALAVSVPAQTYTQTPVTVSKDKIRGSDGNIYFSHVVLEKQTLFSISKAYGVSVEDIYKANPTLHLETESLKKNQILLIPITSTAQREETARQSEPAPEPEVAKEDSQPKDEFIKHTVKWYEDLDDIARKYGCDVQTIMQVNKLTSTKVKKRTKLLIPKHPERWSTSAPAEAPAQAENVPQTGEPEEKVTPEDTPSAETVDNQESPAGGIFDWLLFKEKKELTASLLLPFNSKGTPDPMFMDFYSGVMMAMRDLKASDGITTDLNVYDVAGGNLPVQGERLSAGDLVIGPVSTTDLGKVLDSGIGSAPVISPLDPKAETIVGNYSNLIHAPAPAAAQYMDLVNWIRSDMDSGDKFIVFTEKGTAASPSMALLQKDIEESGIPSSTISYGILEGRNLTGSMTAQFTKEGTNRIVIVSESEAFVTDVVRNLNLMSHMEYKIVLYAPARIRSFDTVGVENFHTVSMHVSCSYYIDYNDQKVKDFVLQYRALFGADPSQFSFQGYDIATYFLTIASKYGSRWPQALTRFDGKGLQSDFNYESQQPRINQAVRRIVYNPDFSITLLK